MRQWLYSANSAPIGTPAGSNFERYSSQATDNADQPAYPATTSPAEQQAIVCGLEKVLLADVPVIPVTEAVDWFQYDTATFCGWPSPSQPVRAASRVQLPGLGASDAAT